MLLVFCGCCSFEPALQSLLPSYFPQLLYSFSLPAIPEWGWMQKPVTGTEASWDWGWWKGEAFSWRSLFSSLQVLSCQNLADPAGTTLHTESVLYLCLLHMELEVYLQPVSCIVIYVGAFSKSDRQSVCITSTSLCSLPVQGDVLMEDVCSQYAQVGEWHALCCGLVEMAR